MITVSIHQNDSVGKKLLRSQQMPSVPRVGDTIILEDSGAHYVKEVIWDLRRPTLWIEVIVK